VSTTHGHTGNLLEFSWSSWKFLTDGATTKATSHKNVCSSPVVWKVLMIMLHNHHHIIYVYLLW